MYLYALKLEQLVQTEEYGDILITIQYDGTGPKLVTALSENIEASNKHALDTVLGLVNFMLAKKIKPFEIANQLEANPQDGLRIALNDLMLIVANSLKQAPATISEINPEILMEVKPEMVKEFTENSVTTNYSSAQQDLSETS